MKSKLIVLCILAIVCSAVSGGDAPNFKLENLKKKAANPLQNPG